MIETVVLGITALILLTANAALRTKHKPKAKTITITKEKTGKNNNHISAPKNTEISAPESTEVYSPYFFPVEEINERSSREKNLYAKGKQIDSKFNELTKTVEFLNKKQDVINQRLTSMENRIRKINGFTNQKESNGIFKKIEKLEDFKRNTIIELEALKMQLKEIKGSRKLIKKKQKTKIQNNNIQSRIHEIIFHSNK